MPTPDESRVNGARDRIWARKLASGAYSVHNPTSGKTYTVSVSAGGAWYCTCPYMTRGSRLGGYCKHIVACSDLEKSPRIPVGSRGLFAIVDSEDYGKLKEYIWSPLVGRNTTYARRTVRLPNGQQKTILMHKEIMDVGPLLEVDHINDDGLDNRKINLREATSSQQRTKAVTHRKVSRFKGVRRNDSKVERYNASINVNCVTHYLGSYDTDVEAAYAYDEAARKYYGDFAVVNFPEVR